MTNSEKKKKRLNKSMKVLSAKLVKAEILNANLKKVLASLKA